MRTEAEDETPSCHDNPEQENTYPRYPVYENEESPSLHKDIKRKEPQQKQSETHPKKKPQNLLKRTFSLEDMVLAGLILLLMNEEDRDDGLLLILGFLLLIGMNPS